MSFSNLKKEFQSRDNIEITIIDSGLGGIIFSESFKESNLGFNVITLIDKEGFPYGNKDLLWLKTRVVKLVCESKSDVVLLACNTLSSIIYNDYIKFDKKVVDVITSPFFKYI